jgi:hypothetical protein
MINVEIERKLISFAGNPTELEKISEDMKNGWYIISLVKNEEYYTGIMEKDNKIRNKNSIYIRPRLKLKITANWK